MALLADRATAPATTRAFTLPTALLTIAVGVVFAVAVGLWRFTWPIADDFVRAVEGRDYGVLGGVWVEYTTWSCRWAAGFVHFLIAAIVPLTQFYGATLGAITLLSLLILSAFVAGTLELRWRSRTTFAVVAIFAALWWSGSPSVNELFFWRAAEVEYQLGWSAAIALAFAAFRLDFAAAPAHRAQLAALAAAALFVSGLHELAAALETGLFAVIALGGWLAHGRWRPAAPTALAFALIGLAIVVAAPGNGAREAAVGTAPPLGHAALAALWQIGRQVALWLVDPKALTAATALIVLRASGTVVPHWPERLTAAARWALSGVFVAALVALYVIPAVALDGAVPARTLAGIHLVFLCGGLVVVTAWAPCAAGWIARRQIDTGKAARWALIALALTLPASRNVAAGIADLRGPAEAFHSFMAARDATLRRLHVDGVAQTTLPVIAKPDFPRSYVFHADIRPDADFWINRWTARYYGMTALRAR